MRPRRLPRGRGLRRRLASPEDRHCLGDRHARPCRPALEFGTVRKAASPWLLPVFRARRGVVNYVLRKAVQAAFRRTRPAV